MGIYKYSIAKELSFIQSTPSQIWIIDYPYAGKAAIDVAVEINGVLNKAIPFNINQISDTRIQVEFTQPYSGKAQLVV